jgi:hypothetical protein
MAATDRTARVVLSYGMGADSTALLLRWINDLASKTALVRAPQLNPRGAWARVAAERRMGHDFKHKLPMRKIVRLARDQVTPVAVQAWRAT